MSSKASSEFSVRVENLSKVYQIYRQPQHRLAQWLFRGKRQYYTEHWAVRDVGFELKRGETVGIVGQNGSGKSTILQMICGTLRPTTGKVEVNGRIAALLELGAGFDPQFTGRENVYLNGAILGFSQAEMDELFDDIAAFAEIGPFIDQPVKTYSSGMAMRLAFAVSVHLKPDVLIVDEALAVGDESFQRKCFARIENFRANGGTLLFVSHSAQQVVNLCDRALLMDKGELLLSDSPKTVVTQYHRLLYSAPAQREALRTALREGCFSDDPAPDAITLPAAAPSAEVVEADDAYDPGLVARSVVSYDRRGAEIRDVHIATPGGRRVNLLRSGGTYQVRYRIRFDTEAAAVGCGTMIKTIDGIELGGSTTVRTEHLVDFVGHGDELEVTHSFTCNLLTGTYFLTAGVSGVVDGERHFLHRLLDAFMFRVVPDERANVVGMIDFNFVSRARLDGAQPAIKVAAHHRAG